MPKKYEQIAADLRRKIHEGGLAPGQRLPIEDDLGDSYDVSPTTIRAALDQLRAEGLIETRHGIGTFVRVPRRRVRRTGERHQWEKDRARAPEEERQRTGAVEHDTGLEFADIQFQASYSSESATEEIAAVFGVEPGTRMLHRAYRARAHAEDAAVSLIDSYLVWDVVAANPDLLDDANEPWPGGTMHQLSTVGIEVDHVIEEFTARPPQPDEAEQLAIGPGIAVLQLRKTSVDILGQVVEYSEVVMPGDRTVMAYITRLKRWPS